MVSGMRRSKTIPSRTAAQQQSHLANQKTFLAGPGPCYPVFEQGTAALISQHYCNQRKQYPGKGFFLEIHQREYHQKKIKGYPGIRIAPPGEYAVKKPIGPPGIDLQKQIRIPLIEPGPYFLKKAERQ